MREFDQHDEVILQLKRAHRKFRPDTWVFVMNRDELVVFDHNEQEMGRFSPAQFDAEVEIPNMFDSNALKLKVGDDIVKLVVTRRDLKAIRAFTMSALIESNPEELDQTRRRDLRIGIISMAFGGLGAFLAMMLAFTDAVRAANVAGTSIVFLVVGGVHLAKAKRYEQATAMQHARGQTVDRGHGVPST